MSRSKVNAVNLDRKMAEEQEQEKEKLSQREHEKRIYQKRLAKVDKREFNSIDVSELMECDTLILRERAKKLRLRVTASDINIVPVDKFVAIERAMCLVNKLKVLELQQKASHKGRDGNPKPKDEHDTSESDEGLNNDRRDENVKVIDAIVTGNGPPPLPPKKKRTRPLPSIPEPVSTSSLSLDWPNPIDYEPDQTASLSSECSDQFDFYGQEQSTTFRVIPLPLRDGNIEYIDRNIYQRFQRCLEEMSIQRTVMRLLRLQIRKVKEDILEKDAPYLVRAYCLLKCFNQDLSDLCIRNFELILSLSTAMYTEGDDDLRAVRYLMEPRDKHLLHIGVVNDLLLEKLIHMQNHITEMSEIEGVMNLEHYFQWHHLQYMVNLFKYIDSNTELMDSLKEIEQSLHDEYTTCDKQLIETKKLADHLDFVRDRCVVIKNRHDLQHRIYLNRKDVTTKRMRQDPPATKHHRKGERSELKKCKHFTEEHDFTLTHKNWLCHEDKFAKWRYPAGTLKATEKGVHSQLNSGQTAKLMCPRRRVC